MAVAFADALTRFKRAERLASLPFYVAIEETLSQKGALGRVWAPLHKLERRLSIVELPSKEGMNCELSDCIGGCFVEERGSQLGPLSRRPRFPTGAPPDDEEPSLEGVVT